MKRSKRVFYRERNNIPGNFDMRVKRRAALTDRNLYFLLIKL